jgi:glutathione synthase/RimK-type ligase-like ATP-grasp enzyme
MDLLILLDYRSQFYSSTRSRGASLDIAYLRKGFESLGYEVSVQQFAKIDLRTTDYKGIFILYQSSEDPSLAYKDYIEDVLFGLHLQGAILIPGLPYFRAHHNKVFMEILRDLHKDPVFRTLASQSFGTYEEYKKFFVSKDFPVVLKPGAGSKSQKVVIARTKKEVDRYARQLSATPSLFNFLLSCRNWFDRKGFSRISNNRRKFTIQPFIPNLSGDYKIVVYGEKYFVLFRENRPNDFRASGSGRLSFPSEVPEEVLSFARQIFESFDIPFISMDVGFDGSTCYLFEFQFVFFGQYAVERSQWHFFRDKEKWNRMETTSIAEEEMVQSVHAYIKKQKGGV